MKAVYITQVGIWRDGGQYVFDRKFYDGMKLYCDLWPGEICCVAWEAAGPKPDFGLVSRAASELPFEVVTLKPGAPLALNDVKNPSIVIGTADDQRQHNLPAICGETPLLLNMEHTPRMRRDIIAQSVRNPFRRFLRLRRLKAVEPGRNRVIQAAAGVASNGPAAHDYYKPYAKSSMCYFDTRATRAMQISAQALERKHRAMLEGKPLRLVFSGRLINIKGVDALLGVARHLARQNVPFTLDVFGSGAMEQHVADAARNNSAIRLRGAVDFESSLMPALKNDFDLFVCCHRQGDPSCTYLETFAAGVPMAGFANETLEPLSAASKAEETVAMGDTKALASLIAQIHFDRPKLVALSQAAADFSRAHAFEDEFKTRIDFWKKLARH